jgi:hypothetical protein
MHISTDMVPVLNSYVVRGYLLTLRAGRRKERREGRREGGLAEGRVSLDFPSDGQDDTSLGGEGGRGGLQGKEGHKDGGVGGVGGLGPPARQGRDDAQLSC